MTPILIHITESGVFKETKYMKSTKEAIKYLRTNGCTFKNSTLYNLEDCSVILTTGATLYEIEEDLIKNGTRIKNAKE